MSTLSEHETGIILLGTTIIPFSINELKTVFDIDHSHTTDSTDEWLMCFPDDAHHLKLYLLTTNEPTIEGLKAYVTRPSPKQAIDTTVKLREKIEFFERVNSNYRGDDVETDFTRGQHNAIVLVLSHLKGLI